MSSFGIIPFSIVDDDDGGPVGLFTGSVQIHKVHAVGFIAGSELSAYMIADGRLTTQYCCQEFHEVTIIGDAVPFLTTYGLGPSSWACIIAADVFDDVFLLRGVAAPVEPGKPLEWQLN